MWETEVEEAAREEDERVIRRKLPNNSDSSWPDSSYGGIASQMSMRSMTSGVPDEEPPPAAPGHRGGVLACWACLVGCLVCLPRKHRSEYLRMGDADVVMLSDEDAQLREALLKEQMAAHSLGMDEKDDFTGWQWHREGGAS